MIAEPENENELAQLRERVETLEAGFQRLVSILEKLFAGMIPEKPDTEEDDWV